MVKFLGERVSELNYSRCKLVIFYIFFCFVLVSTWLINICLIAVQQDALPFIADFFCLLLLIGAREPAVNCTAQSHAIFPTVGVPVQGWKMQNVGYTIASSRDDIKTTSHNWNSKWLNHSNVLSSRSCMWLISYTHPPPPPSPRLPLPTPFFPAVFRSLLFRVSAAIGVVSEKKFGPSLLRRKTGINCFYSGVYLA